MRRTSFSFLSAALLFVANACGENQGKLPTDAAYSIRASKAVAACATYEQIYDLTNTVYGFTPPHGNNALPKLENTKQQLDANNTSLAQSKALDLIDFTVKQQRMGTLLGTDAQVTELVNDILCWVGLAPVVPDATDAFVVLPNDTAMTLVNDAGTAGTKIPANAVSEPTVITIDPIPFTVTSPGAGPLNTKLDQYPGYYYITKISATNAPLLLPVVVAVCPSPSVPASIRERLRLGHEGENGFEVTPNADATFLTCPVEEAPALRASSSAAIPGVSNVSRRAAITLAGATGGVGGTTGTFSPFGTVDTKLSATGGVGGTTGTFIRLGDDEIAAMFNGRPMSSSTSCIEGPTKTAVPAECRPTVSITTLLGTKLENVPVSFDVTAGGGSVAAAGSSGCGSFSHKQVATTDSFGKAIVCWILGNTAGQNTVVALPSTGGDVPAGAVFEPASLSFSMNAFVVDDTPPVIADPVVTGTLGNNGWYTSDISVSWSVTDPESSFTATGCSASVTTNTSGVTLTCSAVNAVGLSAQRSITLKRDATAPAIVYSGNLASYSVDQTVSISCNASDATSGVASTTCQNVAGTAYSFGTGTISRNASATDNAGNSSQASVSFNIGVTFTGVCNLTKQFSNSAAVAASLCTKLDNASKSAAKGDLKAKSGMVNAFIQEVAAQSGKAFTSDQAAVLTSLAQKL